MIESNQQFFFALLQAGLWDREVRPLDIKVIDWSEVYKFASEQSVVGLVAAGLERIGNGKVPQTLALTIAGEVLQIEQRNRAMNAFVGGLIQDLLGGDIYTLLLKGQGVAQCYEKPLWRSCGDIDLFLSSDNYSKAKEYLSIKAKVTEKEIVHRKHIGFSLNGWLIELHGRLECGLSKRINKTLKEIERDTFFNGNVRSWDNDGIHVFMLSVENDVIYVFIHFLNHFYKGGIGLRQICDWCRLLWTYKKSLNFGLLESRIKEAGIMNEWKAFGAFAVDWLGMPVEAMPFYSSDVCWSKKAVKIKDFIMEVGNFGHNRDMSYYSSKPFVVRKAISFKQRVSDMLRHIRIFPLDSIRFFGGVLRSGLHAAVRGE